jgi:hypothetical protein
MVYTNKNKTDFTIILVGETSTSSDYICSLNVSSKGETGTGKTSVLSLFANVLAGRSPEQYEMFHDESNEAGGSKKHSQTKYAKVYEFTSVNGVKFRILDSPGLADTRGIAQDVQHKASIAKAIQDNIATVNAVLILANGTLPRLGVATDYALSTLSSIFPRTLADNIGILFTNVSSPLSWNFEGDSLPDTLQHANQYVLDNPLAMWKKLREIRAKKAPIQKRSSALIQLVEQGHVNAVTMLAEMFDWLDGLDPQPTKDITSLYAKSLDIERSISNALARLSQLTEQKKQLEQIRADSEGDKLVCNTAEVFIFSFHADLFITADHEAVREL